MIKPIPGYKFYSVSDDGIVYYKGKEIHQTNDKSYKKVSILGKTLRVHRLVAMTYLGDIEGKVVMHLDDNPSNNCVSNLNIGSTNDNIQDMLNKGRNSFYGKGTGITIDQKKNILSLGLSTKEIKNIYGVHSNTILFWKKKLGIDTTKKTTYNIDIIKGIIKEEGSNIYLGKKYGVSDMTINRWKKIYG